MSTTTSSELKNLYEKGENYYSGNRSEMFEFLPQTCTRVLDVGCAEGRFGAEIKRLKNCEVWGVDIDDESIKHAESILDKAFSTNITQNLDLLPDEHFDVVFFNDVLEHFIDPYTFLKDIQKKLTKDALIIASIPNMRHFRVLKKLLFEKDFEYEESGVMDKTHLRFFTKKSMIRMFEEAGYNVESAVPINKTKSHRPIFMKLFTLGLIGSDISYLQFVITAKKK